MATEYTVTGWVGTGIIVVLSAQFGKQWWVAGNRPGYRFHTCAICNRKVQPNTEIMYRPLKNPGNRMLRICATCGAK